jgi:uncharacterized membrane protein YesL
MGIDLKLGKTNYFPIYLLWLSTNIGPLAFISTLYINFNEWKQCINELLLLIVLYLSIYTINYLIAAYYFDLGESHLKSHVKQSILNLFAIIRTAIVFIVLAALVYFFTLGTKTLVIFTIGLEILIFLYHFLKKKFRSKSAQE